MPEARKPFLCHGNYCPFESCPEKKKAFHLCSPSAYTVKTGCQEHNKSSHVIETGTSMSILSSKDNSFC